MAKQTINLGSSANDGTGDRLRTAFTKINQNFDELYAGGGTQGATGSQGTIGSAGPQGTIGSAGPQGAAGGGGGAGLPLSNGTSNIDIALANGYVTVTANTFTWTFNETNGLLELAGNLANFSACSAINFVANSSGDGAGYSTIELRPDSNATNDQYLIIDPTTPNHIHIRAGGTQDNSTGQLYIGGENSNFSVGSGENPPVFITANNNVWTYYESGVMQLPVLTYSTLPPASLTGLRSFISDANVAASGNFGAIVGGGGSNNVPVFSDGTDWRIG